MRANRRLKTHFWQGFCFKRLPATVARRHLCPTVARSPKRPDESLATGSWPPRIRPLTPYLRQRPGGVYWYAKWSRRGTPVVRSLGPAWMEPDGIGAWRKRRGRPPEDHLTETQAHARMLELVQSHDADQTLVERDAAERDRRGATFREVALDYLEWLDEVKGAEPSTLRAVRSDLPEPGVAYRRGRGATHGRIMQALERYLHARPATELAERFTRALLGTIGGQAQPGISVSHPARAVRERNRHDPNDSNEDRSAPKGPRGSRGRDRRLRRLSPSISLRSIRFTRRVLTWQRTRPLRSREETNAITRAVRFVDGLAAEDAPPKNVSEGACCPCSTASGYQRAKRSVILPPVEAEESVDGAQVVDADRRTGSGAQPTTAGRAKSA